MRTKTFDNGTNNTGWRPIGAKRTQFSYEAAVDHDPYAVVYLAGCGAGHLLQQKHYVMFFPLVIQFPASRVRREQMAITRYQDERQL